MDSRARRNYILLAAVKRIGIPYRQKEVPYLLVTILGDPITYRDSMIRLKTEPLSIKLEGQIIEVSFNILPLRNNKAVLGIPFLREFNPKINWVIGSVQIKDISISHTG